jgi:small subunit ribosomal protein S4
MVFRLGFAGSRKQARQIVRHRHILVDNRIVDIPSFQVKAKQVIRVKDKSKNLDLVHIALKMARGEDIPWLRLNKAALEGELLEIPKRSEIPLTANEQLIVELYSK